MTDTPERQQPQMDSRSRFFSLRMKFVAFFSLILIATCSSLSWYFIETRHTAMEESLQELGNILLTNTVRNDHFRIGGIVLEDRQTIDQFMQSLMAIDHVVYVVITASDGRILDQHSKWMHQPLSGAPHSSKHLIQPDDNLSELLLRAPLTTPLMSKFVLSQKQTLVPYHAPDWFLPFSVWQETLYDFAMPVLRESSSTALSQHAAELEEPLDPTLPKSASPVVGLVRIGITDAQAKQALLIIIRNISILTLLIITAGILGAHLLTSRITTPLRTLANAAQQLATGNEALVPLTPSTHDEVGQLTHLFNLMTQSLQDRNRAITMNLETIRRQVRQLTTVHQVSTAIASASTLNMDPLFDRLLQLLAENLGFARVAVVLHHASQNTASVAQIIGVSQEIVEAARQLDIPATSENTISADLLIHGKPLLIHNIEAIANRIYQPALELMRRSGVQSFVAVPLQSHAKNIGYLMADRGSDLCLEEDLHILMTIAGHVAAAIDNARAYNDLAELTQTLEQRIEQRTHELSLANEQLHAQDQRRSKYVKIVSHELRTPMTAIRSFAENMLDGIAGPLTDLQHTYLSRTKHSVARLVRLADELLDWSHPDTVRLETICIGQVVTSVADGLATVASDKRVSLAITSLADLPLIQGDQDKLEQILWNLMGNAIKFTPPDGMVTVEFSLCLPGFVQICVTDTGCGIAPDHLPHVFEEFSEVPSAMPSSQGAQLGLSITKALVTKHHGTIWVESAPETGSRFYFTLPIAESQHAASQSI